MERGHTHLRCPHGGPRAWTGAGRVAEPRGVLMGLSKGPLPTSQPQTVALQLCRCARRLQSSPAPQLLSPTVVTSKSPPSETAASSVATWE